MRWHYRASSPQPLTFRLGGIFYFYQKLIITLTLYSRFKYQREHWHLGIGLAQGVGRWLLLFHRATGNFCRLTYGTVGWEQSTFISRQEIFYQV